LKLWWPLAGSSSFLNGSRKETRNDGAARKKRFRGAGLRGKNAGTIKDKEDGMAQQPRAWQRMLSGRRLDLLDPTPVDIEIEDIAHGLAFVARWNGQTVGDFAYSVAEHSLLVETLFRRIAPRSIPKWHLAALLHDAPEYVIGDMISPVKAAVGPGYGELDARLTAAIHIRFGLPASLPVAVKRQIKKADRMSAWMEAVRIAGFSQTEADRFFGKPDEALISNLDIRLRPPMDVRHAFSERHAELMIQTA
jgi:5'-deoxynucleotidase YfbR-like HD superfamily hydrolase